MYLSIYCFMHKSVQITAATCFSHTTNVNFQTPPPSTDYPKLMIYLAHFIGQINLPNSYRKHYYFKFCCTTIVYFIKTLFQKLLGIFYFLKYAMNQFRIIRWLRTDGPWKITQFLWVKQTEMRNVIRLEPLLIIASRTSKFMRYVQIEIFEIKTVKRSASFIRANYLSLTDHSKSFLEFTKYVELCQSRILVSQVIRYTNSSQNVQFFKLDWIKRCWKQSFYERRSH